MTLDPSFLVIDKPVGLTSHDVVGVLRAVTGLRKAGHTGTLDPFATGVLAVALGGATRFISFLDEALKVYDATIQLGARTDTGDLTGTVVAEKPVPDLGAVDLGALLGSFVGPRMQKPPAYSAVKVQGRPLYAYARSGESVPEVAARPITIHAMTAIAVDPEAGRLRVRISCTRGTYARVLAEEIAAALGTEGHLVALAREVSGPFELSRALDFPSLAAIVSGDPDAPWERVLRRPKEGERVPWRPRDDVRAALAERALPLREAFAHLPAVSLTAGEAVRVRHGQLPSRLPPGVAAAGGRFVALREGEMVALGEASPSGPRPLRVVGES